MFSFQKFIEQEASDIPIKSYFKSYKLQITRIVILITLELFNIILMTLITDVLHLQSGFFILIAGIMGRLIQNFGLIFNEIFYLEMKNSTKLNNQ